MTVREWLTAAEAILTSAGISEARIDSQLLLAHCLEKDRTWVLANPHAEFTETNQMVSGLSRRAQREPLAYILGYREFYGRRFRVTPDTLIPRPETEHIVEHILNTARPGDSLLDLGTGSGCIAITCELERPDLSVSACDINPATLDVACSNAEALGATVNFVLSDWFSAFKGQLFHHLVSNPPYVALSEFLEPEIAQFEPNEAVFSGISGFECYENILREATNHLVSGGQIVFECGAGQAGKIAQLAPRYQAEIIQDLAGHDRVLVLRNAANLTEIVEQF